MPTPATQTAGTAFNVTLTALDANGNTATGYTGSKAVIFSGPSASPSGTNPTYPSSVSFSAGVGTASITLTDVQTTTLTATQGSVTGTSGSFTVTVGSATKFALSTPSPTAGAAFNETITATDNAGNPVPSYTGSKTLTFSGPSSSPGGTAPTYPSTVTFTAGVGTASITLTNAQSTTLTATQGLITGTSASFTVAAGSPSKFAVSNPGTQTSGTAFGVTITAADSFGNTTTGYTGSKSVTFSGPSNAPGGAAPTYPSTVTFTNGVGTPNITLTNAQSTTLTATQGSITGTSTSFTVNPGSATRFTVPTPATQTAGTAFNVTLTALDSNGNTATGYTGSKALSFTDPDPSPNGTNPTYPASVTFTAGVGTLTMTTYDAETTTLTAIQGSITGTSGNFTVNAAATSKFGLSTPNPTAGSAFNETLTATDTYGNTTTGYTGSKTVTFSGPSSSPGGTAPTYPSSVNFTAGVGTASITLTNAQSTTLAATQGTVTGTSASFTVSPSSASKFSVANPGSQTSGSAFNVTITALDTYGNTATGYTGSKTLTFSGPTSSPGGTAPTYPGSVSFTNGVASPSITLTNAQSTTLTATQSTLTGTSTSFTVGAGSASTFNVPTPATQTAGTAFNVTLTALDANGNTATSFTGAQSISFSDPDPSPNGTNPSYPASVTFTNGVGTASGLKLYDAESTTLTAFQGSVSGTSGNFTVNGLSTTTKFLLSTPSPTAGSAFTETITATDTYGNTTTGYTGSKSITFSGPSSSPGGNTPTYPGSVSFSAGVGTATITLTNAQTTALTATQSTINGTSASFSVSPAAATKYVVTNPGTQVAGSQFSATITAVDTYGNTATSYTGSQAVTFSGPSNSPNGTAPAYPTSVTFSSGVGRRRSRWPMPSRRR